jgi:signal transduction histidine kinase
LFSANKGLLRIDFLQEVAKIILNFSKCDVIELCIKETKDHLRSKIVRIHKETFQFEIIPFLKIKDGKLNHVKHEDSELRKLCNDILHSHYDPTSHFFTKNGSFWTGDIVNYLTSKSRTKEQLNKKEYFKNRNYKSIALIPLPVNGKNIGLLQLKSTQQDFFTKNEIELYEGITPIIGVALMNQSTQTALTERVKELTCLYGIAKVAEQFDSSLHKILQGIVNLLPPAWQYPEITCAKIVLDGRSFTTPNFQENYQKQTADIVIDGEKRGVVKVVYTKEKPALNEDPFLNEERSLIDTAAKQIAFIIERIQAAEDRLKLQEQLRHADRLATIGQLAAGVAHEINEPLSNILGFTQLAVKCPGLPKQVNEDLEKIIDASLHAREIIKKLMLFSRQKKPEKSNVNLNNLVNEGLYFLESRCAKEGIELVRSLNPNVPEIIADPSQLHQVLVNLIVNSLQAMPEGGVLTIRTNFSKSYVSLIIEDTGTGMSDEVKKQMFIPFFTTKDIGQGTGIGLSVVHGIVTSHGGSIIVESNINKGSRFEIQLPINGTQNKEQIN